MPQKGKYQETMSFSFIYKVLYISFWGALKYIDI
nr:MAG TPA: hypothetical protein [Caudoviricetes sp.]